MLGGTAFMEALIGQINPLRLRVSVPTHIGQIPSFDSLIFDLSWHMLTNQEPNDGLVSIYAHGQWKN
jgi:hypothetical protein